MATTAWCPTERREVALVALDRPPVIEFSVFPRMCVVCRREFTIDGYTLVDDGDLEAPPGPGC